MYKYFITCICVLSVILESLCVGRAINNLLLEPSLFFTLISHLFFQNEEAVITSYTHIYIYPE